MTSLSYFDTAVWSGTQKGSSAILSIHSGGSDPPNNQPVQLGTPRLLGKLLYAVNDKTCYARANFNPPLHSLYEMAVATGKTVPLSLHRTAAMIHSCLYCMNKSFVFSKSSSVAGTQEEGKKRLHFSHR